MYNCNCAIHKIDKISYITLYPLYVYLLFPKYFVYLLSCITDTHTHSHTFSIVSIIFNRPYTSPKQMLRCITIVITSIEWCCIDRITSFTHTNT